MISGFMMTAGSSFSSHEEDKTRIDNTILMSMREGFCFIGVENLITHYPSVGLPTKHVWGLDFSE